MPSRPRSSNITRRLLTTTLFALEVFTAVSASHDVGLPQNNEAPLGAETDPQVAIHEKRLVGLGNVIGLVPSLLGNLVPSGIANSLVSQVTADINSLLPILNDPNTQPSGVVALTTSGQGTLPLSAHPMPTGAQLGGLADKLGGLLNSILPVAAPSIIAAITEQAHDVIASVDAIATDIASLGNQIGSDQIHPPDALSRIGDLLGSLDSKVNGIISGVTSDLASDIPLPVLQDLSQVISSGLGDIVGAANGPVSLVGDLLEQNICGVVTPIDGILATVAGLCGNIHSAVAQVSSEIATASLTNPQATLTDFITASAAAPSSPNITAGPASSVLASLTSHKHRTITNSNVISTSGPNPSSGNAIASSSMAGSAGTGDGGVSKTTTTGVDGIITITEYQATTQQCTSSAAQSTVTIGQTITTTVNPSCPTPLCTSTPQATCDCPGTNATPPAGNGAQGPCPGSGYTCDDCIDGWFCPPSQTPAQSAPCGFGWPCAHCEGGWFCVPHQTPGPCASSRGPRTSSPHATAASSTPSLPSTPKSSAPHHHPSPPPPEKVTGWSYCGCWADQLNQRPLDTESVSMNLLTNEACVQHCIIRGYIMAGTENGSNCLCGNFLNGTQMMDEGVCSIPCSGDDTQKCGGLSALSCYSPDGHPYGWASAGPRLRMPTMIPPEVLALDIGGVAQTLITTPAVIFPPGNADPDKITSVYGKTMSHPLGDFPRDLTLSSSRNMPSSSSLPPTGGGSVAPGRGTPSKPSGGSPSPSISAPLGASTGSTGNNGAPSTPNVTAAPSTPDTSAMASISSTPGTPDTGSSPTKPNGSGGVAPGHRTRPTSPTNGQPSLTTPTGVVPTSPSANITPDISSSVVTASPSNPTENNPGPSGSSSSTPSGAGGVAPGHGRGSSTSPGSQGLSSVPSGDSTAPLNTTPIGTPSLSIPSTASSGPGQGSTPASINTPGGSNPSNTAGITSSAPGPTQGPTSPSRGGGSSGSTPQLSSRSPTDIPSSSSPISAGGVAPHHGQPPTSQPPGGGSITCRPGSSDTACISINPSGSNTRGQSQPTVSSSSVSSTTCSPDDPSCVPPFGGGTVAPGHRKPSASTPSSSPSTCAADSTDPSCTSPFGGGSVAPGHRQPSSSPMTSTPASTPSSPINPTSLTSQPSSSICKPGSTDPNCIVPNNSDSSGSAATPGSTTLGSGPGTSASNAGSTPSGNGGSSAPSGQGPGTPSGIPSGTPPGTSPGTSPGAPESPGSATPSGSGPGSSASPGMSSGTPPGIPETTRPATSPGSGPATSASPGISSGTTPGAPGTSGSATSPGSNNSASTVGSTPSGNGGSSVPSGQGPGTSAGTPPETTPGATTGATPETSPGVPPGTALTTNGSGTPSQGSSVPSGPSSPNQTTQPNSPLPSSLSQGTTSGPNGASGVAPVHRSQGTQPTTSGSATDDSTTTSNSDQGSGTPSVSRESGSSTTSIGTSPNTSLSNGGTPSPSTPGQPTPSNPSQGGGGSSNSASSSSQTSYPYVPGPIPYGTSTPSMTTIASMLAWREPNGEMGAPTMLREALVHDSRSLGQDAPASDFDAALTTGITSSRSTEPRWRRIRPVYVW